jgi:hypothetical protein
MHDHDDSVLHLAARHNLVSGGELRHDLVLGKSAQMTGHHLDTALVLDYKLNAVGEVAGNLVAGGAGGWGRKRDFCAYGERCLVGVVLLLHNGVQIDVDAAIHDALVPVAVALGSGTKAAGGEPSPELASAGNAAMGNAEHLDEGQLLLERLHSARATHVKWIRDQAVPRRREVGRRGYT